MLRRIAILLVGCCSLWVWSSCSVDEVPHQFGIELGPGNRDELGLLPAEVAGFKVTRGAAPGYVDDQACKECHEDLWNSYQEMGMARSFYPPDPTRVIEDMGKVYHQEATGFYYEMSVRDGKYYQKRYCKDDAGNRFAEYEVEATWVIGSGNHVRSYLSQNERGELFQLPLSWYTEDGWAMSPGYDRRGHDRFERVIEQRCMFCHNAYPEMPRGGDAPFRPPVFPKALPHGIGCQRCHGPGARHVEAAADEAATDELIRARILNPAGFTKRQKEDMCMACHMQPDVNSSGDSIGAIHDRPTYSHRPDSDLMEHVAYFDFGTVAERKAKIEVNHHGHRMRQSRCYTESAGRFTCVTCHDPHKKIKKADQPAHYRKICFGCHELDACQMEGMGTTEDPQQADCVRCHMVKARPRDVVHVTITDHLVRRRPPNEDLAAPRPETGKSVGGTLRPVPVFPDRLPEEPYRTIYAAQSCADRIPADLTREWRAAFEKADPAAPGYYLRLGKALMRGKDHAGSLEVLAAAVARFPEHSDVLWNYGLALHLAGRHADALPYAEKSLRKEENPRVRRLLGRLLAQTGDLARARVEFEKALSGTPGSAKIWKPYAFVLMDLGDMDAAVPAFYKAIALDPDFEDGYRVLAEHFERSGDRGKQLELLGFGASRFVSLRQALSMVLLMGGASARDPKRALLEARKAAGEEPRNGRSHLCVAVAIILGGAPFDAAPSIEKARALGADAACCSALAVLDSLRRKDTDAANSNYQRYQQELRQPSQERLRFPLGKVVQAAVSRGR